MRVPIGIRPAGRGDVAAIVAMLADDALGRARERIEDPPPSLRGALATKQSRSFFTATGLLRSARNDGLSKSRLDAPQQLPYLRRRDTSPQREACYLEG